MVIRARWALAGAAGCVVLLLITWFAAFHVGVVRSADRSIFSGFYELSAHGWIHRVAYHLASLCDPSPYVYFVPIPIVIALLRGRPRVAVAVGVILLGANVTTHVLKPLLEEPRSASFFGWNAPIYGATWPSGHATAAMSLALSLVLAVPARMTPGRGGPRRPVRGRRQLLVPDARLAFPERRVRGIPRRRDLDAARRSPGCWPSKRGVLRASARSTRCRPRGARRRRRDARRRHATGDDRGGEPPACGRDVRRRTQGVRRRCARDRRARRSRSRLRSC